MPVLIGELSLSFAYDVVPVLGVVFMFSSCGLLAIETVVSDDVCIFTFLAFVSSVEGLTELAASSFLGFLFLGQ